MYTYNVSGGHSFFLAMFLFNNFLEFVIGPIVHRIIFVFISHINVNASLFHFTFDGQIMRKFTLITLSTLSGFVEGAHHRLWIRSLIDFLRLNRSKRAIASKPFDITQNFMFFFCLIHLKCNFNISCLSLIFFSLPKQCIQFLLFLQFLFLLFFFVIWI